MEREGGTRYSLMKSLPSTSPPPRCLSQPPPPKTNMGRNFKDPRDELFIGGAFIFGGEAVGERGRYSLPPDHNPFSVSCLSLCLVSQSCFSSLCLSTFCCPTARQTLGPESSIKKDRREDKKSIPKWQRRGGGGVKRAKVVTRMPGERHRAKRRRDSWQEDGQEQNSTLGRRIGACGASDGGRWDGLQKGPAREPWSHQRGF